MDIKTYLDLTERKDLLRFLTCGSVDDGKSTLIGRLLYDTDNVPVDHVEALKRDSARIGNAGDNLDYSLLLDGLQAEREQGITIDVAYRYFTTSNRKFIIADTPGHEQYTRNMATGASTADLAIILIDARHGVLSQTKRHSFIATLLNIRHLVVAVNKMDLVDYSEERFNEIVADYQAFAAKLPRAEYSFIPVSALEGENVVHDAPSMPWYQGETLLQKLEAVQVARDRNLEDLMFPVQYVVRPDLDFRGFAGTVASGLVRKGQRVTALPSGKTSTVKSIVTFEGELDKAFPPQSVIVTLNDEIDVSRGDVLVADDSEPHVGTGFEASVVWMHDTALQPGTQYLIKHLTNTVPGSVVEIHHRVDVNTLEHGPGGGELALNEIAKVRISVTRPLVFDLYRNNRSAGAFIIIDRMTNNTVGAGMITDHYAPESQVTKRLLAGASADAGPITATARALRHGQKPVTVWLKGADGEHALAVAHAAEQRLFALGHLPYVLDYSALDLDMRKVLGFTGDERREDLRRVVALSRLCADIGTVTLAVVGADADLGDPSAIGVFIDDGTGDVLAGGDSLLLPGGTDAEAATTRILDLLRDGGYIGIYPGGDVVSI
ncbi:MAG: sulfate adenylyltransferase subunit CysN [Planctomycetota bacterium]|jgi:bifunctional enzyme CysN/CysC